MRYCERAQGGVGLLIALRGSRASAMDAQEFVARGRSMLGRGTVYWAGAGGTDPLCESAAQRLDPGAVWPTLPRQEQMRLASLKEQLDRRGGGPVPACDCSGFVAWALRLARMHPAIPGWHGGDIWTGSIHDDVVGAQSLFEDGRGVARLGSLLVYAKPAGERYGHVGIVTAADAGGRATRVLHCSADNFKDGGDAIAETATTHFDDPALATRVAWCRLIGA